MTAALGRRKARTLAFTRSAGYSVAPGKLRTVTVRLRADGCGGKRSLRARVTITTRAGVSAPRRLTVAQRRGS